MWVRGSSGGSLQWLDDYEVFFGEALRSALVFWLGSSWEAVGFWRMVTLPAVWVSVLVDAYSTCAS